MKTQAPNGFTLVEVIIAITILAFITIFTARMIQHGVQAKMKVQGEIERTSGLTSALQLMSHDVQQAFNYRDVNIELFNASQKKRKAAAGKKTDPGKTGGTTAGGGTVTPADPPPADPVNTVGNPEDEKKYALKEVKIYTRFIGDSEKLNFTSLNNFRGVKNLLQSDQAEIGYYLENCTGPREGNTASNCLWRRLSPYIDEEIKEGGKASVLLEHVKSVKFRYLATKEEEWFEKWDSVEGEEIMKGKFPVAVEITLTILDMKFTPPKDIAMTVVAPLLFPNNKPDEKSPAVP